MDDRHEGASASARRTHPLIASTSFTAPADRSRYHAHRDPPMSPPAPSFRGNKAALPQKPCAACGRPMTWRRRWARTWDEVKYCSDACRRFKGTRG